MTRQRTTTRADAAPHVVVSYSTTLSPDAALTLASLNRAVAEELDRKRRLGHCAVFWRDGQVVHVQPEDLPSLPSMPSTR